jgi:PII-like signaling protein
MSNERLKTAKLVRVFIAEEDTYKGEPLYKYILEWCMENGIAGATVFKAFAGYGKHKKLRKHSLLPKKNLPIVVEIIDEPQKVEEKLIPFLKSVVKEGLITTETVYILE